MSNIIPIILAGGQGTRLWPASLPDIPKQFLTIEGQSLMQGAISRALAIASDEIVIVTNENYLHLFSQKLSLSHEETTKINLIGETAARNTAPAIALALEFIEQKYSDAIAVVITADHLITPTKDFADNVQQAVQFAKQDKIVTFGIKPSRPDTGYGYIECGEINTADKATAYTVNAFKEKPNTQTAQEYIQKGTYLWNSGMFCFSVTHMKKSMYDYCPKLASDIFDKKITWHSETKNNYPTHIAKDMAYETIEKISIDYAVMEKANNVMVVPASFNWNDVGSWEEAADLQDKNSTKNIYTAESSNVNVFSDIPVGICGLDDIIVVVENNRVLVMKKGSGQLVKQIAEKDST